MNTVFSISDAEIVKDGSKTEIISSFEKLQAKVDNFEKNKKNDETMFIAVNWVGSVIDLKLPDAPGKCNDGTKCPEVYGVTRDCGLIPVIEYMSRLSAGESSHVLFVQELNHSIDVKDSVNRDNTWEMKQDNHCGWSRLTYVRTMKFGGFWQYFAKENKENDKSIF